MASKSSSPGPNPAIATLTKQGRSRKAATQNANAGRAGSAGGIVLERENEAKGKGAPISSKPIVQPAAQGVSASTTTTIPRRKPRKLNKDPAPNTTSSQPKVSATTDKAGSVEPPTAIELEALKSRVRGLEAKVEELYKNGTLDRPGRSPRRRGKGRKNSSQQQVPTLASTDKQPVATEEEEEVEEIGRGNGDADGDEEVEELVRLEGELEVARQDLAAYRPRNTRKSSGQTYVDEEEDIEEIPRDDGKPGNGKSASRHVTLSGSYRIPLPASVSVDDVKHIQSGVSAAQNVARSFLEQRRAAAVVNNIPATPPATKKTPKRPTPKSVKSSLEIAEVGGPEGKQSWSEWIGGYSVAISRAVKSIEHEAAVESQRASPGTRSGPAGAKKGTGGAKKSGSAGKRPGVKTKLSGEQVDGLMR
ncbi:hypothetical protein EK21DRAFT_118136 [Setomelanomma holmii]|uniref:Uncharacterized protein n=1 Tax=Setomelanomma holmii TaxID=210430 RepID=A0A9P4LF56_9PLEO|nr:hypothetical protein EK21DRAFT_118136 [Setomelanomma holmii]